MTKVSCLARAPGAIPCLACLAASLSHSDEARAGEAVRSIGVSGGIYAPYDDVHEEVYGTAFTGSVDFSGRIGNGDSWFDIGVGFRRQVGQEFGGRATFEIENATYVVVPLSMGLRANLAPAAREIGTSVRAYVAAGMMLANVFFTPPAVIGDRQHATASGIYLELRPEIGLGGSWQSFARARLELLRNVRLDRARDLNPGGTRLQAGVSRWF